MATRATKKPIIVDTERETILDRVPLLDEMMYDGEALSPALQVLYSEMGLSEETVAEVFVYKMMDDAKKTWAGVWKGLPEDYDLQEIAKIHGSDEYKVCVYITANGHKTKRGEKVFAWLLSPAEEAARTAPQAMPQAESHLVDIEGVIERTMRMLLPAMQQVQAPPVNPMQMFEMSLSMAKLLQPAQSNTDPISMMKLFMDMQRDMKQEISPQDKGEGSNTNDIIVGLIDKFGGPLANIVMAGQAQQQAQAQQMQQPQQTQNIAYNPTALAEPQQNPLNPLENEELQKMQMIAAEQLKFGLDFLVQQAVAGNPFETYAEVAIDAVPQDALDEILNNPDPLAWLATFDVRVNDHKQWFSNMLDEIKKILSSSDEPETQNA
jgi:hypothetical protein